MAIPNTFTNGTVANATEVNANFSATNPAIDSIYTGNGFDTSSGGTTSNSHELDTVVTADLTNKTYVKIKILYTTIVRNGSDTNQGGSCTLKIEAKAVGGSYSDSMAVVIVGKSLSISASPKIEEYTNTRSIEWLHTLTSGEKSAGLVLQVTSTSTVATSGTSSLTNVQTAVQVIAG